MNDPRRTLWTLWVIVLAILGVLVAAPTIAGPDPTPYSEAGASVLGFVLTLLAMTAGVGSLAVREALLRDIWSGAADLRSRQGAARVIREMLAAWVLCLVVAGMGLLLAWASDRPTLAWPYVLGTLVLLAFHAPRTSVIAPSLEATARR